MNAQPLTPAQARTLAAVATHQRDVYAVHRRSGAPETTEGFHGTQAVLADLVDLGLVVRTTYPAGPSTYALAPTQAASAANVAALTQALDLLDQARRAIRSASSVDDDVDRAIMAALAVTVEASAVTGATLQAVQR